jgi:hypothetical protein
MNGDSKLIEEKLDQVQKNICLNLDYIFDTYLGVLLSFSNFIFRALFLPRDGSWGLFVCFRSN